MTLTWDPPGPGPWQQDRAHIPSAQTALMRDLFSESFERGFEEAFAGYGLLLDRLAIRFVNGFAYHQVQPFDMPGPDGPPSPEQIGAEIGRRAEIAAAALENRIWRDDMQRWDAEVKPAAVARHRQLYERDLASLDDAELADHIRELADHARAMVHQHHRFNVSALLPVGQFLLQAAEWVQQPPPSLLGVLDGYSPVSGLVPPELEPAVHALRSDPEAADMLKDPADPAETLSALKQRVPEVGDYVAAVGYRVVEGFDATNPTIGECPELVIGRLAAALDADPGAARARADAKAAELRQRVPDDQRGAFDDLLAEARLVYRLRDERGLYSDISAIGLMRLAALEAGRRLESNGKLRAAEHALEATAAELVGLLGGATEPSADELRDRRAGRDALGVEDAPRHLGPPPPEPPPLDGLPAPLAAVMAPVGFAIEGVLGELPGPAGAEKVVGGISGNAGVYEGRARLVFGIDQLMELEPGEVLVAPTTGEAFNSVLHLLGAIVTDHGSFACHAGIVAREMGIPAVVGSTNATSRIPDGAMIRVDGTAGEVTILS